MIGPTFNLSTGQDYNDARKTRKISQNKSTKKERQHKVSDRRRMKLKKRIKKWKKCNTKLILYSRLNEKKASVISKQVKIIKGNDKIQNSRWKKSSNFNPTKERLLSALGGNALNQTCGGKPFNSTLSSSTSGSAFSKDTLTTLLACEADIAEKCGNPMTENVSKLAELEACESLADNFKSEFSKCFAVGKTMDESCACVEDISESDVASMQDCDVSSDNTAAVKAKQACKAAVGKCKTAEAAAVEGIDTCKAPFAATTSPKVSQKSASDVSDTMKS